MKTEAQIKAEIARIQGWEDSGDLYEKFQALNWVLEDEVEESALTPEQSTKFFRALEWAGQEGADPRQKYCLVCGAYKPDVPARNQRLIGHSMDCIYAEVFYK